MWLSLALLIVSGGCTANIEPGHEGVIFKKPYLFGSDGVEPEPVKPGRVWIAWTTSVMSVDMRPQRFDEEFDDMMTFDNAPVDFSAYAFLQVRQGKAPELISKFGKDLTQVWKADLQEQFRTMTRREALKRKMTPLITGFEDASDPTKQPVAVMEAIGERVRKQMEAYIEEKGLPIDIFDVQISKATPAGKVVDAMAETMAQQQRSKTEDERKKAEDSRKAAENSRATADREYMTRMGLDPAQYIQLEQIRAFREIAEKLAGQPNTHIVLSPGNVGGGSSLPLTMPVTNPTTIGIPAESPNK